MCERCYGRRAILAVSGESAIRIATRRSPLALAQAGAYATELARAADRPVELVEVTTTGDVTSGSLAKFGGLGVFVGAVRQAVLDGHADLGVHSLKDVPTAANPELMTYAYPERADPRDVLCSAAGVELSQLPPGSRVGTGSLRRQAQLLAARPDLHVVDVRGNVDTRLGLVASGELDAVVLAAAGLIRLDRVKAASHFLPVDVMLPAPGQGSLAVEGIIDLETRDPDLHKAVVSTDNLATRFAVIGERAVLNELEAGCSAPVGAFADMAGGSDLQLRAIVARTDGSQQIRMNTSGPAANADALGRELADQMLRAGAAGLMGGVSDGDEGEKG